MKFLRSDDQILLRLVPGEEIHHCLKTLARGQSIPSATLTGLGAVGEITLAWWDLAQRAYLPLVLIENLEIVSMTGNLAWSDGEPMAHIHAVVSRPDGTTRGGHVMTGIVSVTLEISLRLMSARVERRMDGEAGLKLLALP